MLKRDPNYVEKRPKLCCKKFVAHTQNAFYLYMNPQTSRALRKIRASFLHICNEMIWRVMYIDGVIYMELYMGLYTCSIFTSNLRQILWHTHRMLSISIWMHTHNVLSVWYKVFLYKYATLWHKMQRLCVWIYTCSTFHWILSHVWYDFSLYKYARLWCNM